MPIDHRAALRNVRTIKQLVAYLRDEMRWPMKDATFDDLTFDYTAEELGIDPKNAAKIEEIKRLRPLSARQPWGIFFVKFEPKKLPVVALRRILSQVALKKRASANSAERTAWAADDLLFISNYGEGDERQISFAHFSQTEAKQDLPTLKVLGWDNLDTALHLDSIAKELTEHLSWPENDADIEAWRKQWRGAFTLRHREVITTSRDLSIRLAELARVIRDRIRTALTIETKTGGLTKLMRVFQEALIHDLDAEGFADMYAQTIAYGLLSARVTNPQANTADGFAAQLPVTNPFLKELMETFLHVGGRKGKTGRRPGIDFDELGVSEVVELLDDSNMEAVLRDFGDLKPEEDPVIHFYELFLKEYDAKKRMQRGVFYTPRPVVSYIVRSVHELLRTEFGLADGLADTATWGEMVKRHEGLTIPEGVKPTDSFVIILDPATGTGTFLVEVIEVIHCALVEKWKRLGHGENKIIDLWNDYVPKHLLPRLHGYELMMAPYAIAHMKVGLKLHETGYRFESEERARIYLTNALEPAQDLSDHLAFDVPALANEAQAVNAIKSHQRFTVVIGNPPYSYMSANLTPAAAALIEPFRFVDGEKIHERSALSLERSLQDDFVKFFGLTLRLRRETGPAFILGFITNSSYMDSPLHRGLRGEFLRHFSSIRLLNLFGDSIKDGEENVFDIQQGVAIFLGIALRGDSPSRLFSSGAHGTCAEKYSALAQRTWGDAGFVEIHPEPPQRYFLHLENGGEYSRFPSLADIFQLTSTCIKTLKDDLATGFDPNEVLEKIEYFRNPRTAENEIKERFGVEDVVQWKIAPARRAVQGLQLKESLAQYQARPFDYRSMFYHSAIVGSPRQEVMRNLMRGRNLALIANRKVRTDECHHFWVTSRICVSEIISSADNSNCFPLYILPEEGGLDFGTDSHPNFAPEFLKQVSTTLKLPQVPPHGLPKGVSPDDILHYAYATFHSPTYRSRYDQFLKIDFPHLPLTRDMKLFQALAQLGGDLAALHLMESPRLDKRQTEFIGGRNPRVEKISWSNKSVWIDKAQSIGFKGVPEAVWNFQIGCYQVCEKWLKDRKGRVLTKDDIDRYQRIVVALNETIRIMAEIDKVILKHGGWPGAFAQEDSKSGKLPRASTNP